MNDDNVGVLHLERGQELPVALALIALARRGAHARLAPADAEELLMLVDGATSAIEQLVDRLEPAAGATVYARASRFVDRFENVLQRLRANRGDGSRP